MGGFLTCYMATVISNYILYFHNFFIGAFKMFTPVLVLTQGGPYDSTTTIGYMLYVEAFQFWKSGFASSIAVVLFGIIFTITLIQFRVTGRRVFYSEGSRGEE